MTKNIFRITTILIIFCTISCNKILDEKPDKALVIPKSISDFQALMDFNSLMNNSSPNADEGLADNCYVTDEQYDQWTLIEQNSYTWNYTYYTVSTDWQNIYQPIYIANLVLEGLSEISPRNDQLSDWRNAKGAAYFFRAQSLLSGAFIYCLAYDSSYADTEYGMVLRLSSNFNEKSVRSNLHDTYYQIINDLENAIKLLSPHSSTPYRPTKEAAYALLARTYLSMRKYDNAGKYADSSLQIKNDLLDYNDLNTNSLIQFSEDNPEIIFYRRIGGYSFPSSYPLQVRVDTLLYDQYEENDLRKAAYFYPMDPGYIFKGTYSGQFKQNFTGIATDEVYLMRAEYYARNGNVDLAMTDLNTILEKRWKAGTFIPFVATNPKEALDIILQERRKELIFRSLRWMDIKRLNLEGRGIILKRKVHGKEYLLTPNSRKFAFILSGSLVDTYGIPQNTY